MMVSVYHGRTEIVTYQAVLDQLMLSRNQTVNVISMQPRLIAKGE